MGMNASACVADTAFTASEIGFNFRTSYDVIEDNDKKKEKEKSDIWYIKNGIFAYDINILIPLDK